MRCAWKIGGGLLAVMLLACGGSGGITPPDTTTHVLVDPFASIYVENVMTSASGRLANRYVIEMIFEDTLNNQKVNRMASVSPIHPGDQACFSLNGFVGQRRITLLGIADTLDNPYALTRPDADFDKAAAGTMTFPGMVVRSTGLFDPLVSADTTRGHSRQRPVKWRWTFSDAGQTFVEDSTTVCEW